MDDKRVKDFPEGEKGSQGGGREKGRRKSDGGREGREGGVRGRGGWAKGGREVEGLKEVGREYE